MMKISRKIVNYVQDIPTGYSTKSKGSCSKKLGCASLKEG